MKDLAAGSDLAEGLLNNVDRPPVQAARQRTRALRRPAAAALQRSGRVRRAGRAGDQPGVERRWVTLPKPRCTISGMASGLRRMCTRGIRVVVRDFGRGAAGPPKGGYAGAVRERQPGDDFRLGGAA